MKRDHLKASTAHVKQGRKLNSSLWLGIRVEEANNLLCNQHEDLIVHHKIAQERN